MSSTAALLAQAAGFSTASSSTSNARARSPSRQGRSPQLSPVISYAPLSACPFASAAAIASGAEAPHPIRSTSTNSSSSPASSSSCSYLSSADVLASSPSSSSSSSTSSSPSPPPSNVGKEALQTRLAEEVASGVLVENDDASGLYLPPLLSLLPESISPSGVSSPRSSSGATTPALGAAAPTPNPAPVQYTLTRLPSIDAVSLSLHTALHAFRPVTPMYSIAPYAEAFNWPELVLEDVVTPEGEVVDVGEEEREWYIVAFRSRRRRDLEEEEARELYEKDRAAHEEAVSAHGGLIAYWFGSPIPITSPSSSSAAPSSSPTADLEGRNLATCIWSSRTHALNAMRGPHHAAAARLAGRTYESYTLERYVLRKERGERGVKVLPWHGGEVVGA
ncbi:hypothetical protein JCM6882_007995 [Rhodosporidiobolus microsporus]